MSAAPAFVLVPSPLVGPDTWEPVGEALAGLGAVARVAVLPEPASGPTWPAHVDEIARLLRVGGPAALVAHSNAGLLLPAAAQRAGHPPAAYVFVDAVLPVPGATRLEVLASESPVTARALRARLEAGGVFPAWSEQDLVELVPDAWRRQRLVRGIRPRGPEFFDEAVPVPPSWSRAGDAPCAYLRFSEPYRHWAGVARRLGWRQDDLPGGHFHALVEPRAVAVRLVELARALPASS